MHCAIPCQVVTSRAQTPLVRIIKPITISCAHPTLRRSLPLEHLATVLLRRTPPPFAPSCSSVAGGGQVTSRLTTFENTAVRTMGVLIITLDLRIVGARVLLLLRSDAINISHVYHTTAGGDACERRNASLRIVSRQVLTCPNSYRVISSRSYHIR